MTTHAGFWVGMSAGLVAGAALGIALLKQEHTPSYISVYDTDDDLF